MIRFPLEYPVAPLLSPLVKRSTTAARSPKSPQRSRRVRFAPGTHVHSSTPQYTPREARACWYTQSEYTNMKKDAFNTIRAELRGCRVESMLGLDYRTLRGQCRRQDAQYDIQYAVLLEYSTEEERMRAYQEAGATKSAKDANVRGKLLAIEVRMEDQRPKGNSWRTNKLESVFPAPPKATPLRQLLRSRTTSNISLPKRNKKAIRRLTLFLAAPVPKKSRLPTASSASFITV